MDHIVPVEHFALRQRINRLQQLAGDAFRLLQRPMRQQHGKVAAVVAGQQRARVAHNKGGEQVDQRKEIFFRGPLSPGVAQEIEIRQANHHHHPVRPHFFRIVEQRGELIIKEKAVVEAGFVILGGIGADQRIHSAALVAGKLDFREQRIQGAAGA